MVTGILSHPLGGGPSTQLNRVTGGGQWLSMGLSISRPSSMSHLVIVTNSLTAWHRSLMLFTRGGHPGLLADKPFLPNAANIGNRPWLEALASATHLDIPVF